jgi:hypothetical protein
MVEIWGSTISSRILSLPVHMKKYLLVGCAHVRNFSLQKKKDPLKKNVNLISTNVK